MDAMKPRAFSLALTLLLALAGTCAAASAQVLPRIDPPADAKQEPAAVRKAELVSRSFQVGETERWALVHTPESAIRRDGLAPEALAAAKGAPLVFVFHGHGGTARQIARRAPVHRSWPEAVVVYPQGLRTPGALTDPEGKRFGWQGDADAQDGRDLAFVDVMIEQLGEELVLDPRRLHATGHSNGGGFTYLLWAERGREFASFAPSAAAATKTLRQAELAPRPVLHFGSPDDPLVRWSWQQRTLDGLKRLFDCGAGEPWPAVDGVVRFPSPSGADVFLLEHEGGHRMWPELAEVAVAFFQAHPLPADSGAEILDGGPGGDEQAEERQREESEHSGGLPAEGLRRRRAG